MSSLDIVFHGVAYNLNVTVARAGAGAAEESLAVDLEELGTDASWHGEFSASFVEAMTGKTGSFKAFDVFVKMLQGALWQQSDTVFVDLLTYADLVRARAWSARRAVRARPRLTPARPLPDARRRR